jgi:hypothetical protein
MEGVEGLKVCRCSSEQWIFISCDAWALGISWDFSKGGFCFQLRVLKEGRVGEPEEALILGSGWVIAGHQLYIMRG